MNDELKLCAECKYCDKATANIGPICIHREAKMIDYVFGNDWQKDCSAMRIHTCGPEGKLWEPRA